MLDRTERRSVFLCVNVMCADVLRICRRYPDTNAVLVRRHGVYVWGESWQKAKTMCECYDYLFEIAVRVSQDACVHASEGQKGAFVGWVPGYVLTPSLLPSVPPR